MSGIDISSYCRRLAQLSEAKLALFYTVGLLPATFLGELATVQPGLEWLKVVAAVLGLCALSALVAVVTFYRDDEVPLAGVILGLITVFGTALAWVLSKCGNPAIIRRSDRIRGRRPIRTTREAPFCGSGVCSARLGAAKVPAMVRARYPLGRRLEPAFGCAAPCSSEAANKTSISGSAPCPVA